MKKNKTLIFIVLIGIIILGFYFTKGGLQTNPEAPLIGDGDEAIVSMQADGYMPNEITIKKDTKVTFVNDDSGPRWPASDLHPSHGIYSAFDPRRPIKAGESWSFTFDKVGEWTMHDHLAPYIKGIVTVVE